MVTRALAVAVSCAVCSCGIDADPPRVTAVMPQMVCGAATVTVTGSGFTPLPERTLVGEQLALPTVTLANMGTSSTVSGPSLRWRSEAQLDFDVPLDGLPPSLYDVAVTNPDGHAGQLAQALTLMPPPAMTGVTIASVSPRSICDAQSDQTIAVSGSGFVVGATEVELLGSVRGGVQFTAMANVADRGTLQFVVPQGTVSAGLYTLRVRVPVTGNGCTPGSGGAATADVAISDGPHLASAKPGRLCLSGTTLTLAGVGFESGAMVSVSDGTNSLSATTTVSDAMNATAVFPATTLFTKRTSVSLVLANPDGCSDSLSLVVRMGNNCG
jgi:hypothetical protein